MVKGIPANLLKLNPLGTGKQIIGNEAILAVLASSILSPILVPTITNYINKLPYVASHVTIAAAIPAILLFRIGYQYAKQNNRRLNFGCRGIFCVDRCNPIYCAINSTG